MYTLVLMTAMSTSPTITEFGGLFNRNNCSGSCTGCSGCTGCCGGGGFLSRFNFLGGSGCCGSTTCSGCSGCTGCTGCCGSETGFMARVRRLFGREGCCGGCCGGGCCGGCCGGMMMPGIVGGPMPTAGPIYDTLPPMGTPAIPFAPPEVAPPPITAPAVIPERSGFQPAAGKVPAPTSNGRGTVIVRLPADARLYAGDRPLNLSGGERRFVTPELPVGQDYTYRFRAEYVRDGETISVTKRIAVRAGGSAALEFADFTTARPAPHAAPPANERPPVIATATAATKPVPSVQPEVTPAPAAPQSERATITVKLPAGATLYVDDRKNGSGEPVRSFTTPPVPAGREFAYLMKAEVTTNGRPETLTQKVAFRAGERITVDFTGSGAAAWGR